MAVNKSKYKSAFCSIEKIFSILLLSSLMFIFINTNAQEDQKRIELVKDTLDIPKRLQKINFTYDVDFPVFQNPDTSITHFYNYNPLEKELGNYSWLSNVGQYQLPLTLKQNKSLDFNWGFNNLSAYEYKKGNIKHFYTDVPYTEAQYNWGLYDQSVFNVLHGQNIKDNLNLTADYRVIGSNGIYARQKTSVQNLAVTTWYKSLGKRYQNWFSVVNNSYKLEQNGGVIENDLWIYRTSIKGQAAVNLGSARNDENNRKISFKQSYSGGYQYERVVIDTIKISIPDTTVSDTTLALVPVDSLLEIQNPFSRGSANNKFIDSIRIDTIIKKELIPFWSLTHEIAQERKRYSFKDNNVNTTKYPNIYIDSTKTNDSLIQRVWENEFAFILNGRNPFKKDSTDLGFRFKSAFTHQFIDLDTKNTISDSTEFRKRENFQNAYLSFKLFNIPQQKLSYDFGVKLGLFGFQSGSILLDAAVSYPFSFGNANAYFKSINREVDYLFTDLTTNHFIWRNDFKKYNHSILGFKYIHPKKYFSIEANQQLLSSWAYLDTLQIARQHDKIINVQQLKVQTNFKWKKITIDQNIIFQNSDNNIVAIPNFIYNGSAYLDNRVFKNALDFQVGVLLSYRSNYYAPDFTSSIAQYYVQTDQKQKYYPTIDFFINAKINTVRLFIKSQNLNQDLFGPSFSGGYYSAPLYPMFDRTIHAGLSWQFYD